MKFQNLSFFIPTSWNLIIYLYISSFHYLHSYYQKFTIYLCHITQSAVNDTRNSSISIVLHVDYTANEHIILEPCCGMLHEVLNNFYKNSCTSCFEN